LTPLFIFERKGLIMENESKFIRRQRSTILVILTLSLLAAPARGYWYNDPVNGVATICNAPGEQAYPKVCLLNGGRTLIAWCDNRTSTQKVYYQLINGKGVPLLENNGIPIFDGEWVTGWGTIEMNSIVPDGQGGAIFVVADYRSGCVRIYGQRIDSLGNRLWGNTGLLLVDWLGTQDIKPKDVTFDGLGNYFIACVVCAPNTSYDIYAQKFTCDGQQVWGASGTPVCTESHEQIYPKIVADENGGILSVWEDNRAGGDYYHLYMQHMHSEGFSMLQTDGIQLLLPSGGYISGDLCEAVADGGGGGVYSYITNFAENYLHVFRVTEMGRVPWDWSNWNLSSHWFRDILRHPLDGTIWVSCADNASEILYRLGINGFPLLGEQGIPYGGMLAPSSTGIISCMFAQQNTLNGVFVGFGGSTFNTAISQNISHHYPEAISDGSDGAVCTWGDGRNFGVSGYDIFAQRLLADSTLGSPRPAPYKSSTPSVGLDMIGHTAHFNLPQAGDAKLEIFDMLGRRNSTLLQSYQTVGDHQLPINTNNLPSGIYLLRLTAPQVAQAIKIVVMK
jgi:hypothetical protein